MEKNAYSRLTRKEYRRFGFLFGTGMLVLSLVGLWRGFPFPIIMVTVGLWLYHWIVGILWPPLLWGSEWVISRLWKGIVQVISFFVLGVLFFGILTPLFWILRLVGEDHIQKNKGYWRDFSPKENDPKRMERWF